LDPCVGGAFADLVEVPGQRSCVLRAQVRGADAPAQIDLQMFAAERGDVAGPGAVAGDGLLKAGGIEVLPTTTDRTEREPRRVEHLLQILWRPVQVLCDVLLEWLEAVVAILRRHSDARLRVRRRRPELMSAHRVAHLVARKSVGERCQGGACARTQKFAAIQNRSGGLRPRGPPTPPLAGPRCPAPLRAPRAAAARGTRLRRARLWRAQAVMRLRYETGPSSRLEQHTAYSWPQQPRGPSGTGSSGIASTGGSPSA